jgi:hypothetical protein
MIGGGPMWIMMFLELAVLVAIVAVVVLAIRKKPSSSANKDG